METLKAIGIILLFIIVSGALLGLAFWAMAVFGAFLYATFGLGGLVMCAALLIAISRTA